MGKIRVYAPDSMDWTGNGLAALIPTECIITEESGGEYELEMQHPVDPWGKWEYLVYEAIIKAPVPMQNIQAIEATFANYWRVKTNVTADVIVYAKPLIYTYDYPPSTSAWSGTAHYNTGTYVSYNGGVYRYIGVNGQITAPPGQSSYWQYVSQYNPSDPGHYTGGGKVGQLYAGDKFIKLADYNSDWMRIRIMGMGIDGYIKTTYCEETSETVPPTPARRITEQCFRVYNVSVDSEEMMVTVNARHISFDFRQIAIGACEVKHASPATAISLLQGATLIEDVRTIATNMENPTVTWDYSWNNAIYALLDEEVGLVHQLKAKLLRDNNDFFILKNDEVDNGFTIEYGNNLIGVTWNTDVDSVKTRLVPRAETASGEVLFLPEQFVDSSIKDDFAVVRMDPVDTGYKVGDEYTDEYDVTTTLTENDVFILMRKECSRMYNVDRVDVPEFSLDVEFLMLGDTEEFKQYKGLQVLAMYDTVTIKHPPLKMLKRMQMVGYKWDAMLERYISAHFDGYFNGVVREELLTRPSRPMQDNNYDMCVVSASTRKSGSNPVYYSFNDNVANGWVPAQNDSTPWIQMRMDTALTDIKVYVYSRDTSALAHPGAGYVELSNDGTNWSDKIYFSGWTQKTGQLCGTVECENTEAYTFVRLTTTAKSANTSDMSIGYITITGKVIYDH